MNLENYISVVENWPKQGISFKDITTLLLNGEAYKYSIDKIVEYAKNKEANLIVGPEARGFLVGCPVAYSLGIGFVPVRKPNKLPRKVISCEYELEYSVNTLSIHEDSIKPGDKVLIVDDLLATGGTIDATIKLIEKLGGTVVGIAFLIELKDLKAIDKFKNYDVFSLLKM